MTATIEETLSNYAKDLETRLANKKRVSGLKPTESPTSLIKDARQTTIDLMRRSSGTKYRIVTNSSSWSKRTLEQMREAIRKCLNEPDAEVVPFASDLQSTLQSLAMSFNAPCLSRDEIDDIKRGAPLGEYFLDVLRKGHERRVVDELSKKFIGQDPWSDLQQSMIRELANAEQSIMDYFAPLPTGRYKAHFASSVWLATKLLYGYAIIGDGIGYRQLKPLVEIYASDRACIPFCRRERHRHDPRRWLIVIGS